MKIEHDPKNSKFFVKFGAAEAHLDYRKGPGHIYNLIHTVVPEEAQGKGVAQELVKAALELAKKEKAQIIATCSYVQNWFDKNPEEKGILVKS